MKNIIALGAENKNNFTIFSKNGLYVSNPKNDLADINNLKEFENDLKTHIRDNNIMPDTTRWLGPDDFFHFVLYDSWRQNDS